MAGDARGRACTRRCGTAAPTAGEQPERLAGGRRGRGEPPADRRRLGSTGPGHQRPDLAGLRRERFDRPDIDWVTEFENETGCKVNAQIFGTSDEAYTL